MPESRIAFSSLPSQVAAVIRRDIENGTWTEWLPGERALCESLHISRKTLRKALAHLEREGLIASLHGRGNRVVATSAKKKVSARGEPTVALLTPEPLELMRPFTSLWVNALKTLLIDNSVRLRTVAGRKYFSPQPARALERLVQQQPATCWLLANSTEATQRWFEQQQVPCVIAGSCHPGVDLPDIDLNQRALCRHAAGVLIRAGHRRVALLQERAGRAGDLEGEEGFLAGVRESGRREIELNVATHEHSVAQLARALGRLLDLARPPTALLVSSPSGYLTVVSVLAHRGLRVPRDLSIISRDDEPFLDHLLPPPARYSCPPAMFARKLVRPLLQVVGGETLSVRHTRLLPAFRRGGSIAAPRSDSGAAS